VSKGKLPGEITGRIVATPNPIPFGEGSKATISWQTTDPAGAEVRVLIPTGGEKLVSRGNGGSVVVPWIQPRSGFEFRLYSGSEPSRLLDRVTVRHDDGSWGKIFDSLASEPGWENVHLTAVANYIAKVIPRCLNHPQFRDLFLQWERHGFHVTPVHFYQPIPDTRTLTDAIWAKPGSLAGVDMKEDGQLDLLRNVFPHFRNEYDAIPRSATGKRGEFYFDNGLFSGTDALVTYCMVRHFQPRLIIEVEDDGVGMGGAQLEESSSWAGMGIGMANISERLQVLYGGTARMTIDSHEGKGTLIRIRLPLVETASSVPEGFYAERSSTRR